MARSKKICRIVSKLVGVEGKCQYESFAAFLDTVSTLVGETKEHRCKRMHVDYQRFKRELYQERWGLHPMVAWTQIRSHIKGSMEAVQQGRPLTSKEYLELGSKVCRLSLDQKKQAYEAFLCYKSQLESRGLWDDSDRVTYILGNLRKLSPECLGSAQYTRVYVDEVQDYSQAELALFFWLNSDGKSLYFAGDNAQSVVEGAEFRFEDIRAVAYKLGAHIPEKPLTVNKNFRSHAGILNLAAAVLERLFAAFPASCHRLPPDEGLFSGPRPSSCGVVNMKALKDLLERNANLHVLCHDESVKSLKEKLGCRNVVLGLRASKGGSQPRRLYIYVLSCLTGRFFVRTSGQVWSFATLSL